MTPSESKEADPTDDPPVVRLIKAGLELGVAEAARKVTERAPKVGKSIRDATGTSLVWTGALTKEMGKLLREDPDSVIQMVKEVWSRGGPKEKKLAAETLGQSVGKVIPYKAVAAARDLARMARSNKEAQMVGENILEPMMERNPALVERVKGFLKENEEYVQRAAIAALVAFASKNKKKVGVVVQGLMILYDTKEEEIRKNVRVALKKVAEVDPKETAKAVTAWAKSDPTQKRIETAKEAVKSVPTKAKATVEKLVFSGLEKLSNGDGKKGARRDGS